MKKILSLFISLMLIFSVSATFAADTEYPLAKIMLDISGEGITSASNKIGDGISLFGNEQTSSGVYNVRADKNIMGENVVIINKRPSYSGSGINNNDTRMQISTSNIDSGSVSFRFKLYLAASSDGNLAMRMRQGSSGYAVTQDIMKLEPECFKWYDIETFVDFESTTDNCYIAAFNTDGSLHKRIDFTCDFTDKTLGYFFLWGTPTSTAMPQGAPSVVSGEEAFYAMKDFSIVHTTGDKKATITSIASDGMANHSQPNLSFTLSQNIPSLTKDHVSVKIDGGAETKASSVTSGSDGSVSAVLEANLAPWTSYTLVISPECYSGYMEIASDALRAVTPITGKFYTSAAPFDIKEPVFNYDGTKLSADTQIINTTGASEDVTLVFASYDSEGRVKKITSTTYAEFLADYPGEDVTVADAVSEGDSLRLFVINGWENKTPLFGKSWSVNYDGTPGEQADSVSAVNTEPGTLLADEFDYDDIKIKFRLSAASSAVTSGVLTVYKDGEVLGDANVPVYADYVTTANDGTLSKEIKFNKNLPYGTYKAEFLTADSAAVVTSFNYYSPAQLLDNKRNKIYSDAKSSATSGALMQVILGVDSDEKLINDNFEVFASDADTSDYKSVKDKDEVFARMISKVSSLGSYNELVELFESCAKAQLKSETKPSGGGGGGGSAVSSNNKNYGSSSNLITESVGTSGSAVSGNTAVSAHFEDMKGHWAEKFAEDLADRGIIDGYTDGTFRGNNNITRAELAKILVGAFEFTQTGDALFTDVSSDRWYASYVVRAAAGGIVTGYADGRFAPDDNVTRQDAVLMLYRALSHMQELPAGYTLFKDDLDISSYAQDATRCLGELGIVTGNEQREFRPLDSITRAEVAAIICRSFDYIESH